MIRGNRANCAQFAQSYRLDWLVNRLESQQSSKGKLVLLNWSAGQSTCWSVVCAIMYYTIIGGGQPIPDKVFMVMSRPKSKVYYCFIKLSGIFLQKDCHIHNYCFFIAPAAVSSVLYRPNVRSEIISLVETNATPLLIGGKQNPEYTAWEHLRSIHSEVHSSKCRLGQSETSKIGENSWSFNNTKKPLIWSNR